MGKRPADHDATQDISASQLVPPQRPAVPHQPGVRAGDQSMWIGNVVGADAFMGQQTKPKASKRKLVLGLAALLAVGGAAGGYYLYTQQSQTEPSASPYKPNPPGGSGSAKPTAVAAAVAPADAAVAPPAAKPDAAVAAVAETLKADAVSAVGEVVKRDPAKKKTTTKKKPTAKKVVKKPVRKKK